MSATSANGSFSGFGCLLAWPRLAGPRAFRSFWASTSTTCISASANFAMLSARAGLNFFVVASFVWTSGSGSRLAWGSCEEFDPLLLDAVRPALGRATAPGRSKSANRSVAFFDGSDRRAT